MLVLQWGVGAGVCDAAPRRATIINLARDQQAGALLAARVRRMVNAHRNLALMPSGDLSAALEAALVEQGPNLSQVSRAQTHIGSARDALARFAHAESLEALMRAEAAALASGPGAHSLGLLGEIALLRGIANLRSGRSDAAFAAFALAHRLKPARGALDPRVYPPEEVDAYHSAKAAATQRRNQHPATEVEFTSLFDGAQVFINGKARGRTPLTVKLAPGDYYIWSHFAGRHVTSERLLIADSDNRERQVIRLHFGQVTLDDEARQWREQLIEDTAPLTLAPDIELVRIARRAASMTAAEVVVFIADDERGQLRVGAQLLRDNASPTVDVWRVVSDGEIDKMLAGVQGREWDSGLVAPGLTKATGPRDEDRSVWRERWFQVAVGSGVTASVISIVLLSMRDGDGGGPDGLCCRVE